MSEEEEQEYKYGYLAHRLYQTLTTPKKWTQFFKDWMTIIGLILAVIIFLLTVYGIYLLAVDLVLEASGEPGKESFANIRNSLFIFAALIGIPFFLWRTWIARRQSLSAEQQAETARDRAYTELFTKAIEQLGAEKPKKEEVLDENAKPVLDNSGQPQMREIYVPNIEVRIGAIYALERIMKDSKKDAPAIVDTLAAYVRENCGEAQELECEIPEAINFKNVGDWVSAIKDYIGNPRFPEEDTLVAKAKALKNPSTNRSDIKTALTVIGRRPPWLKDPKDFEDITTERPDLSGVNLQGWNLQGFDLSFCILSNAKMQGADMSIAQMQGAVMNTAQMQGAVMRHAQMQKANMSYAEMQGAVMSRAEMQGAEMYGAEMQGADMRHAEISEVQITEARKTAASVIWVDLTETKFEFETLQAQLPEMFGHKEHTTLPKDMEKPEHWSEADMNSEDGWEQYSREWEAFKKEKGV